MLTHREVHRDHPDQQTLWITFVRTVKRQHLALMEEKELSAHEFGALPMTCPSQKQGILLGL